ncbi:DUF4142 domain-containing protein [Azospirillum halopraeferens]|uniref:DUF4142 domain-containing protein n=1 Tax=Azospirillum halopraeferens TaxID=34010 RepID=UPI000687DEF6|nr:DUF4142 domain-containing protein [Azospirillum halopraeferens]
MSSFHRAVLATAAVFALTACAANSDVSDLALPTESFGASAAAGDASGASAATTLTVTDQSFLTQAAYGGLAEVATGQLAAERAASPTVRDLGRRMVSEHDMVNRELMALAQAKGMSPPTAPDMGRQATAAALGTLEGAEFDRQYLQQQLAEHAVAIALYDAQARGVGDPDVRAFAARWLPALRDHERQIRAMAAPTAGLMR